MPFATTKASSSFTNKYSLWNFFFVDDFKNQIHQGEFPVTKPKKNITYFPFLMIINALGLLND